jgi:hypothetical protein
MEGWLEKYSKGGELNYNDSHVSIPPDFVGMSNDTSGRNYSPAWNGQFLNGGNIPGSVGFTYARTKGIPSNGKYGKKTPASAEDGRTIYYKNGEDFIPKSMEDGGSVYSDIVNYLPIPQEQQKTREDYGVYGIIPSPMQAYQFEKSYRDVQNMDLSTGDIQLIDNRNVPSTQKFGHKMNRNVVTALIEGAKQRGLNPSKVISIALAESGGKGLNPLGDLSQNLEKYDVMEKYAKKYPEGITYKTVINESLDNLVKKREYGRRLGITDELSLDQLWNGYGKQMNTYNKKGIVDLSKTKDYGYRVDDFDKNIISKNPEIQSMIKMKQGGQLKQLDQLTNFTNFGEPKRWLEKYNT